MIHPVPKPRKKSRGVKRRDGDPEKLVWLRGLSCDLFNRANCSGITHAAHIPSRGAGGSDASTLPLCYHHHIVEQHRLGVQTFANTYYGSMHKLKERIAFYAVQWERAKNLGWP